MTKWYMHKLDSVLENEMQRILSYLEIKTDQQILTRRSNWMLNNKNKRSWHRVDFPLPADHGVKIKESEKIDKYLDLAWELKIKLPVYIFNNPSARTGYDTRSIFKQGLTGLNSEFSFSYTSFLTKAEEPSLPYYLPIARGILIGFISFPKYLYKQSSSL